VEFHRSAFKHGHDESAIMHAVDKAAAVIDIDRTPIHQRCSPSALILPATSSKSSGYNSTTSTW